MRVVARTGRLRLWIGISLLLHFGALLMPASVIEFFFPRSAPVPEGVPNDLTPDFVHVAFVILPVEERPAASATEGAVVVTEDTEPESYWDAQPPSEAAGPSNAVQGNVAADELPLLPPVPRLIVPPALDDLGITSLRVSISILVNTSGIPEQIILPDSLADRETRKRLMECARRFRFEPARRGGMPVASWIDLPLVVESSDWR